MNRLKALLSTWRRPRYNTESKDCEMQMMLIEDHPPGYPRFSALIAAHYSFQICRRFSNLRARLLLLKQDRLSILEKKLERIDREETALLFLGNSRCDHNQERSAVLSEIDSALADYDEFVERNSRMLGFEDAKPRAVLSLQNWVDGNACIAREETKYLTQGNELLCVASPHDGAMTRLEDWVADKLIRFCKGFYKSRCDGVSNDPRVYVPSGSLLSQIARTLVAFLIIVYLLGPVIVCNAVGNSVARMIVIIIATILFIATMSGLTKARFVEIFVAGATYATVLVVFVSGASSGIN